MNNVVYRHAMRGCYAALLTLAFTTATARAQWPQWGGPDRNFTVDAKDLADKWPEDGPKKIWTRDLGDGFATITADDGRLYTMYRVGEDEFSVALDAKTGKTVWEHKNHSPFTQLMAEFGPGPSSTPLIVGPHVYTVGTNMVFHCFDKKTGNVVWKHDLAEEFKAPIPGRGYSCSPIAYKNTVILPIGAEEGVQGQCIAAFDQKSGSLVWKNQSFDITHASPILIKQGGEDQLVAFMAEQVVGLNPESGDLLWEHPHKTQYGANLMTPVWTGGDIIFTSAAYDSGSRAIRLAKKDGKTVPEELWYSRKIRMHHTNPVHVGDFLYGSSGDFGPAFLFAVSIKTGDIAWRERGFAKATCIHADGRLIILDEDGQLALATVTPEKLTILSKCQLLDRTAWAAPTLVDRTLYVRDRKKLMALDLG